MGLWTLVIVSALSAAEVLFILNSISDHALKVTLGYKVYIDVIYGLGMTVYMGLSGTISGVVIAAFSGAMMTLALATAAAMIGTRKRRTLKDGKVVWIETPPAWTKERIKQKAIEMKDKAVSLKDQYLPQAA